ncbi:MAG: hypothetical protein BWK80_41235, partial [Desulfobacteraceae bacterium IS3]
GVTVSDMTLKQAKYHPIHVVATDNADVTDTIIKNVHIIDPGQQAIKINQNSAKTHFADKGIISGCRIELTDAGRQKVFEINSSCYTGGVDGHQARGWEVRDNVIEGFWCEKGKVCPNMGFTSGAAAVIRLWNATDSLTILVE